MRAVQLVDWRAQPELREVERPSPGAGQVLVKVDAVGLCHSDVHVMDWPPGTFTWELPMTLGHETAGTVAALGPGASGVAVGDPVLVYGPWGCGSCAQCARGSDNLCQVRRACGLGFDGGLADYVVVPSPRYLVSRGELSAAQAAPLTDAGLTPYHALKSQLWRLIPGSSVVVIGVGGLGHIAVQLVRELSPSRIVAIDVREHALDLARQVGAHATLNASALEPEDLRAETGGSGADLVLDFVGSDRTLRLGASVLALGGHVSVIGLDGSSFPCGVGEVPLEWSAGRPSWGTLPELHEVVALARAGLIEVEVEELSLAEAIEGYERLRRGGATGRLVVVP